MVLLLYHPNHRPDNKKGSDKIHRKLNLIKNDTGLEFWINYTTTRYSIL